MARQQVMQILRGQSMQALPMMGNSKPEPGLRHVVAPGD